MKPNSFILGWIVLYQFKKYKVEKSFLHSEFFKCYFYTYMILVFLVHGHVIGVLFGFVFSLFTFASFPALSSSVMTFVLVSMTCFSSLFLDRHIVALESLLFSLTPFPASSSSVTTFVSASMTFFSSLGLDWLKVANIFWRRLKPPPRPWLLLGL